MSKKIEIDYENQHYVLEYNRTAIRYMESQGFSLNDIINKSMTMTEIAFLAAFIKNHKQVKGAEATNIFYHIPDKNELRDALIEMYAETYTSLLDATDENGDNDGKKASWKMS